MFHTFKAADQQTRIDKEENALNDFMQINDMLIVL